MHKSDVNSAAIADYSSAKKRKSKNEQDDLVGNTDVHELLKRKASLSSFFSVTSMMLVFRIASR